MSTAVDQALVDAFYAPFTSPKHMQDWINTFLQIHIPLGHVDPDSNSSPIEAMYEAYACYRDDYCLQIPGYIWLSSRDSGKTLCGTILNYTLMLHFGAQVSHLAAIKKQAEKSLQYMNGFVRQTRPYLEARGRSVTSESKTKVQILNEDGSASYIDVIVATLSGGNSEHVPVASYDELDTLSPQGLIGYNEAKLIPTRYKGKGPLVIKYSTRKFSFGIFQSEIENIQNTGERLLRWNIIDITEYCKPTRHKPELPRVDRYIGKDLPLRNISPEEWNEKNDKEKPQFEHINAHGGCATCPLLAVCKTRLSQRPVTDVGGLYRDVDFTLRQFKITSPDMAAAQLMTWRPSQSGLVYPRFEETENSISLEECFATLGNAGIRDPHMSMLVKALKERGIKIYVSGDWGFAAKTAFIVQCVAPNGDWWILDSFAQGDLEFDEILEQAKKFRDMYKPTKWYMDTAEPMFIKTFRRNGMSCADFKKDVLGGIECARGQVIDATGRRRMKILKTEHNQIVVNGFRKHYFILDTLGKPTDKPDDGEIWSDVMDSIRYGAQNLFGKVNSKVVIANQPVIATGLIENKDPRVYQDWGKLKDAAYTRLSTDQGQTEQINDTSNPFANVLRQVMDQE